MAQWAFCHIDGLIISMKRKGNHMSLLKELEEWDSASQVGKKRLNRWIQKAERLEAIARAYEQDRRVLTYIYEIECEPADMDPQVTLDRAVRYAGYDLHPEAYSPPWGES